MKTPVTIFSGYLGSGKTTIIMKALAQYPTPPNFGLIKNEYGDANVDAQLLRTTHLQVKEIVNGCLCCVLVGSLNPAIEELIALQKPERILIEASGNAHPFPILLELKKNDKVYVDGVIGVIDCENFSGIKDTSFVAREQAKFTDLVIFNKTSRVDADRLYTIKEEVFGLTPDIVSIETDDGAVDPRILFGVKHADRGFKEESHHHEEIDQFVYKETRSFDLEKVEEVLNACSPNSFYRIKGMVKTPEGWRLVNKVFARLTLDDLPAFDAKESTLIFIGKDILKFQPMIEDYLQKAVV